MVEWDRLSVHLSMSGYPGGPGSKGGKSNIAEYGNKIKNSSSSASESLPVLGRSSWFIDKSK